MCVCVCAYVCVRVCVFSVLRSLERTSGYSDKFMPLHDDLVNQKMASYIETVGRISVPSIFINTSTFLKLKEKVDEKTGVLLVGPKGCGKSVTLIRTTQRQP